MDFTRRTVVRMLLVGIWAVSLFTLAFPASAQAQAGGGGTHTVVAGDTLNKIAQQYGTDVATLMELNGLSNANFVYVGQQLVVSGGGGQGQARWNEDESEQWQGSNTPPGTSWEPQSSQGNSNSYPAGRSWEPPANEQGNYRQGVAYDPSASQRAGVAWEPQGSDSEDEWGSPRAESNRYPAGSSWEPEENDARSSRPYEENEDWGWVSESDGNRQGNSWEPPQNARGSRGTELTGEKWIDIDISDQTLTAYQGDTEVRYFIISSGSSTYPTVQGSFRTYARYEAQDMSGGSQANGTYYFQADVPWVQYFHEGYAIHGAYWHNLFGTPIGHGCINMRVGDSEWLYDWTGVAGIRVEVHQ